VPFVNSVDCKKLLSGTYGNHAVFAKPICIGSGCKWCSLYTSSGLFLILKCF